jgi:large subunit ribosomal protein L6
MSRIGNRAIPIPDGTKVTINDREVVAEGKHGRLSVTVGDTVGLELRDRRLVVTNASGLKSDKKFHGLYRSLLNNIIVGVSEGFTRRLEIVGVGYKAAVQGAELVIDAGYSHSVHLPIPHGVKAGVEKGIVTLWGIDKQVVGQFAANIRKVRPPEPYKGKGIKYTEEIIRRKAGKAGAVGKGD